MRKPNMTRIARIRRHVAAIRDDIERDKWLGRGIPQSQRVRSEMLVALNRLEANLAIMVAVHDMVSAAKGDI